MEKTLKKYEAEQTSTNIKGRSSRKRTVRTKERIEVVRLNVENNAINLSYKQNGLGLSHSTFKKL